MLIGEICQGGLESPKIGYRFRFDKYFDQDKERLKLDELTKYLKDGDQYFKSQHSKNFQV